MTRTSRASHPRAVNKDRSESRSGFGTNVPKSGAGHHNWGSLADERELESQAIEDEEIDRSGALPGATTIRSRSTSPRAKPELSRSSSTLSQEDIQEARKVRKNAVKKMANGDLDLTAIARSSGAISTSPPNAVNLIRTSP